MKPSAFFLLAIIGICSTCSTGTEKFRDDKYGAIEFRCLPFDMDAVQLLDGPFQKATQLNIKSLLQYEPDRLLARFRMEAGLEPRAEHYHGWEDRTIAGHSLGHYMSACALMYGTSGDPEFLDRINYMVDELAECQQAIGNGYIGAIPGGQKILEDEVAKGDIRVEPFNLNGIWVPFYSMHKIMSGLRDAYRLCGNERALEVESALGDWLAGIISGLSEEHVQEILSCEHGGINEPLADLYGDTGDETYLDLSRKFHHRAILDPLSRGEDILDGKHGNTQIPKLVGVARRYELTTDPVDRQTAEFFWDRVVNHHSYVNGSHSNHEHFGPPDQLNDRLSSYTSESCNVYNILKLTEHVFTWEASAEVSEFYERALINHILSTQRPDDGRVMYFHSLLMGGYKVYQDPFGFTCCMCTGMENHSKYGKAVYYHSEDELFISQFIASELDWKEKGLIVRQTTGFPEEQATRLEFLNEGPVELTLQVRYPSWTTGDFSISVNGEVVPVKDQPGSFVAVDGTWQAGDVVVIDMPFSMHTEAMPDNPGRIGILYGPLVLAGDLGPAQNYLAGDPLYVPGLVVEDEDPSGWLAKVEDQLNTFTTDQVGRPGDVILRPVYKIHDRNFTVYWDVFSGEEWESHLSGIEAWKQERTELDNRTIDRVMPGPDAESQTHNFRSDRAGFREYNAEMGVQSGSEFSYDLKVEKGKPAVLLVEYWGGHLGSRAFDILVDGEVVGSMDFADLNENKRFEVPYDIPVASTSDGMVTVTFAAHEESSAGPIFGLRTTLTD